MSEKKIIHFTNSYNSLAEILNTNGFHLSYCGEIFTVNAQRISSAAHPMVCFSGYTENDLIDRNVTYGRYGIQMKRDWIEAKKINPVLYVDQSSQVALSLGKLLRARQGRESFELPEDLRLSVIQLKCFTKNTKGHNSYFERDDFPFHEENEWRFVPTLSELDGAKLSQNLSTYENNKRKHKIKLSGHSLDFNIINIEKVYVHHEYEVEGVLELLGGRVEVVVSPWFTDLNAYNKALKTDSQRLAVSTQSLA